MFHSILCVLMIYTEYVYLCALYIIPQNGTTVYRLYDIWALTNHVVDTCQLFVWITVYNQYDMWTLKTVGDKYWYEFQKEYDISV